MRSFALAITLCGCGSEVVAIPTPACEQAILDGPIDSATALRVARCAIDAPSVALLSLDGVGSGPEALEGDLAEWDVIFLGDDVVHAVGLGAGLEPGTAQHPPESLFPGGQCADVITLATNSADLLPHAVATLSSGSDPLRFRISSDCLASGTSQQIVVQRGVDRMIYASDGKLVEECLACSAGDASACCAL